MGSEDPRGRDDLCGRALMVEPFWEEYDPETWYEAEDGFDYCCREVWGGTDDGQCIWHADVANKPAEKLAAARSAEPARLDRAVLRESDLREEVSLSECRLRDADLGGVVLRRADLSEAIFVDADLGGADLVGADLTGAIFVDADLSGARLQEADLGGADFRRADLTGAIFDDADLGGADLRRADLGEANLAEADLGGADLAEADLSGAVFEDADLSGARLQEADLGGADLWRADLGGADLVGADLGGAVFWRTDLGGANLWRANLGGAVLQDSRLSDATFQGADLTAANLERADCTRANLFDADLTGAGLYGAVLANVQLNTDTAFGDHYTGEAANPDKAAWTLRQLERLFRENALPGKARDAYLDRKDRRRRQYWHRALVPGPVRRVVAGGKAWARRVRRGVGARLPAVGTDPRADDGSGGTGGDAAAVAPGDLSRGERLVATVKWTRAAAVGVTTRYAASPWRVVGVSLAVVAGSTVAYQLVGPLVRSARPDGAGLVGGDLVATVPVGLPAWLAEGLTSLYFSVVTFTTLGYGDLRPATGAAQAVATVESFVGAFLLALLVYVFGRRATR